MDQARLLDSLLAAAGLDALEQERRAALVRYVELLVKWNRVWNLTAVRDPVEMLSRHIVDSLSLLPFLDRGLDRLACVSGADIDLLDIGSGAGLPVLPLAIARPGMQCLSVERTDKKARFQRQVVLELALDHVQVRSGRIESVSVSSRIVTSRAFMEPAAFLALAADYVVDDGLALLMLGRAGRLPESLPAGWSLQALEPVVSSGDDVQRHVAVCRLSTPAGSRTVEPLHSGA